MVGAFTWLVPKKIEEMKELDVEVPEDAPEVEEWKDNRRKEEEDFPREGPLFGERGEDARSPREGPLYPGRKEEKMQWKTKSLRSGRSGWHAQSQPREPRRP